MNVRYRVELSQTERAELMALLSGGKHAARKLKRPAPKWAAPTPTPLPSASPGQRVIITVQRCIKSSLLGLILYQPSLALTHRLRGIPDPATHNPLI
jgi:hypothetical protein